MSEESSQWSCPACTLTNAFLAEACEACGTTSPLVIESYACEAQGFTSEEQLQAAIAGGRSRASTNGSSSSRSRGNSRDSDGNFAEDVAGEMDPWVQAEREWAHVEAHQEERPKRKHTIASEGASINREQKRLSMVFCGADFEVSKTPAAPTSIGNAAKKAVNGGARKSKNIRELAAHAQNLMEISHGLGWHVAVGTDFAVDLRYRKGSCVLLSSRGSKMKVLLYRTIPAQTAIPSEDHAVLLSDEVAGTKNRLKQRVAVNECDMDAEMKEDVLAKAKRLLEHFHQDPEVDSKVAQALKHSLTFKYGHTWHSIVSTSRELCCVPHFTPQTLVDFSIDKYRVVVYRHAGSDVDTKMDIVRMGNRLSLLLALVCLVIYGYFVFTATEKDQLCLSGKQSDAITRLPVGCRLKDVVQANTNAAWKGMALFGTVLCTVVASGLRMYRSSLRQKPKQI